jgi:hypothetical protein
MESTTVTKQEDDDSQVIRSSSPSVEFINVGTLDQPGTQTNNSQILSASFKIFHIFSIKQQNLLKVLQNRGKEELVCKNNLFKFCNDTN